LTYLFNPKSYNNPLLSNPSHRKEERGEREREGGRLAIEINKEEETSILPCTSLAYL